MIEIREIAPGGRLRDFLDVVDLIYREDPCFVRPLDADLAQRLGPRNPFFEHAEAAYFTAHRDGRCVGRVTAQADRLHLERHQDATGFFGFCDTIEDEEVATALLGRAAAWLRERGLRRVRGPLSLSINEEIGCLVEGFATPPMILMPHHRPYQGGLIERAGFAKAKDLYAWRYVVGRTPARVAQAYEEVQALAELRARPLDPRRLERDVRLVMEIFNDAWSENWGAVPFTESELHQMARDLKMLLVPELTVLVEIAGEPAAMAIALPNVNEAIADLHGRLFPFGLPRLLWRLKVKRPRTVRVPLLGIRRKFRGVRRYAGLSLFLYGALQRAGERLGYSWGELSWTLEDNAPINTAIRLMGGEIYKRYRVYERDL